MADGSSSDVADRLYPGQNGNQNNQNGKQGNSGNGNAEIATPYVVTNMTTGKTMYFDPNTGDSFEMETRNDVTSDSEPGADDPYWGRITGAEIGKLGKSFGTAKIYTDDYPRARIMHGGGDNPKLVPDPYAPRQGWVKTKGCTRGQNEDMEEMARRVQQFKKDHPNVDIMYYRVRPGE